MDRQQHALAEALQRGVERRAVDGRVVTQQALGEDGGGAVGRAVLLDDRRVDGEPLQREARLALRCVGGDRVGPHAPATQRRRMGQVADQARLLGVDEAQRGGAPERVDLVGPRVEGGAHRADALADARQQQGRVGTAQVARGHLGAGVRLAELVGEHRHERLQRDHPRLAAGHRDLGRRAEAVAVRRREVADAGEDRGAVLGEGEHGDELVALGGELRQRGGR